MDNRRSTKASVHRKDFQVVIFGKNEFDTYCFGKKYEDTIKIHLVTYETLVWGYERVFKKPMESWLKKQLILEAGCAMGHIMEDFLKNGIECEGYEPSDYAIKNAIPSVKDRIIKATHDEAFSQILTNEYDIVYANSLQYSLDEKDVYRWVKEVVRICRHSLFFVCVTTQGLHRCISGENIWKMQIIKSKNWWKNLFINSGFSEVYWLNGVMAICLKQPK